MDEQQTKDFHETWNRVKELQAKNIPNHSKAEIIKHFVVLGAKVIALILSLYWASKIQNNDIKICAYIFLAYTIAR